jgi:hypothetical protein
VGEEELLPRRDRASRKTHGISITADSDLEAAIQASLQFAETERKPTRNPEPYTTNSSPHRNPSQKKEVDNTTNQNNKVVEISTQTTSSHNTTAQSKEDEDIQKAIQESLLNQNHAEDSDNDLEKALRLSRNHAEDSDNDLEKALHLSRSDFSNKQRKSELQSLQMEEEERLVREALRLSMQQTAPCPVCSVMVEEKQLEKHVNSHFD